MLDGCVGSRPLASWPQRKGSIPAGLSRRGKERVYSHLRGSGELDRPRHNVKQTIERTDSGAELVEKHGLRLGQAYWTVGQIGSLGNVRTTTL